MVTLNYSGGFFPKVGLGKNEINIIFQKNIAWTLGMFIFYINKFIKKINLSFNINEF
jgi:hypothetical protein